MVKGDVSSQARVPCSGGLSCHLTSQEFIAVISTHRGRYLSQCRAHAFLAAMSSSKSLVVCRLVGRLVGRLVENSDETQILMKPKFG